MLTRLRRTPFGVQVLIGLVLGIALGALARSMGGTDEDPNWLTTTLTTIGSTFVTMLRVLVPPLVVLAVLTSIANLRQVTNAARLAWQTLLWFAITALIAVGIGIAIGVLTDPGERSSVAASAAKDPSSTGSWLDFLQGIVPGNTFGLEASAAKDGSISLNFNVLQLLVIAVVLGVAVLKVGEKAEPSWPSPAPRWPSSRPSCGGSSGSPPSAPSACSARPSRRTAGTP